MHRVWALPGHTDKLTVLLQTVLTGVNRPRAESCVSEWSDTTSHASQSQTSSHLSAPNTLQPHSNTVKHSPPNTLQPHSNTIKHSAPNTLESHRNSIELYCIPESSRFSISCKTSAWQTVQLSKFLTLWTLKQLAMVKLPTQLIMVSVYYLKMVPNWTLSWLDLACTILD